MAKKQKKSGFGKLLKSQNLSVTSKEPNTILPSMDFMEEGTVQMDSEATAYLAELKARKMSFEEFRVEFGNDLDILELTTGYINSSETGHYKGQVLAVRYSGKTGPAELFTMPDSGGPVPGDVFDYLASFWLC